MYHTVYHNVVQRVGHDPFITQRLYSPFQQWPDLKGFGKGKGEDETDKGDKPADKKKEPVDNKKRKDSAQPADKRKGSEAMPIPKIMEPEPEPQDKKKTGKYICNTCY